MYIRPLFANLVTYMKVIFIKISAINNQEEHGKGTSELIVAHSSNTWLPIRDGRYSIIIVD